MRITVCVKEVLDPDAVDNYALAGRLEIGEDGRTLTQTAIPRLMNAYDEQALEAALRLRDAGAECTITVISVGKDPTSMLKHAAAMGADEIVAIEVDPDAVDHHVVAAALAAYVERSGAADLILCGRQASDDDQGVVPGLLGERLRVPVLTVARALELHGADGERLVRVTRVTPEGDELVETRCPAVVTVSNELGEPRYPSTARKLAVRRMRPAVVSLEELSLSPCDCRPRLQLVRQFVPAIAGHCRFLSGTTARELAERLLGLLREDGALG